MLTSFFPKRITDDNMDILLLFCEYVLNITAHIISYPDCFAVEAFRKQLQLVEDKINYLEISNNDGIILLVPKSQPAVEVASITSAPLSFKTLEYNHHSLHDNLPEKLAILKLMTDDIEPQRKELKTINGTLESSLFQMLQKFVRHNNKDNPYISSMTPQETEEAYDDIYQMWLIAKLELDNVKRSKRVKELLGKINS